MTDERRLYCLTTARMCAVFERQDTLKALHVKPGFT